MKDLLLCLKGCNPQWGEKQQQRKHNSTKVCSCCETRKPVEEFYLKENKANGSTYRDSYCKRCRISKTQARRAA